MPMLWGWVYDICHIVYVLVDLHNKVYISKGGMFQVMYVCIQVKQVDDGCECNAPH